MSQSCVGIACIDQNAIANVALFSEIPGVYGSSVGETQIIATCTGGTPSQAPVAWNEPEDIDESKTGKAGFTVPITDSCTFQLGSINFQGRTFNATTTTGDVVSLVHGPLTGSVRVSSAWNEGIMTLTMTLLAFQPTEQIPLPPGCSTKTQQSILDCLARMSKELTDQDLTPTTADAYAWLSRACDDDDSVFVLCASKSGQRSNSTNPRIIMKCDRGNWYGLTLNGNTVEFLSCDPETDTQKCNGTTTDKYIGASYGFLNLPAKAETVIAETQSTCISCHPNGNTALPLRFRTPNPNNFGTCKLGKLKCDPDSELSRFERLACTLQKSGQHP